METNLLRLVVGPFTDIKTGYRGFEMKRNHVLVCLLLCSENLSQAYMSLNLHLEMAFARYY